MPAPILLTKAPNTAGLSRNEDVKITRDRYPDQGASFANAIEMGLNGGDKVEKRANRGLDTEPATGRPRSRAAETPETPPTEGDQNLEQGRQKIPPAPSPSDRGYHTLRVFVAAGGKSSPQAESQVQVALSDQGLDTGVDEIEGTEISEDELAQIAEVEGVAELTDGPTDAIASTPIDTLQDAVAKQPNSNLVEQALGGPPGAGEVLGEEAGTRAVPRESIKENASATGVDLQRSAGAEPKKEFSDTIRQGIREQSLQPEPPTMGKEREHSPLPAPSEQRADARPEVASTLLRGTQSIGAGGSSPSAPTTTPTTLSGAELPDGLGNQIRWMLNRQSPVAEIKLNPAELGSMEVRIALDKEATNIQFLVQNAATKEMVEDALPRLRALLSEVGVNLQDVSVKERTAGDHQQNTHSGLAEGRNQAFSEGDGHSPEEAGDELTATSIAVTDRIVDAYA